MKLIYFLFSVVVLFSCNQKPRDIVQDGAVVEKLAGDFSFTEGPATDAQGNVYFTDQPNDRIMKWSIDDQLTTWMQPSGRSNGLCFGNDGRLWACADENNEMWIIDMEQNIDTLFNSYEGGKLNGPNDVWVAPNGDVYFSDPFYKRPWWDRDTTQQTCEGVFLLKNGQLPLVRIIDNLQQPNGIIGTPDGKMLYITDIKDKKTYSYTINDDGMISDKKLFCDMGSDGMTLDNQGNLYLTNAGGVFVFDKNGVQIKNIKIDEPWTANVCFGGKDMQSLFVTAKSGLYRIRMNVKGVGSQ